MDDATNRGVEPAANRPHPAAANGRAASSPGLWRQSLYAFIKAVYFERITVLHRERLPRSGPILYLGLHRNGAVDGFVYDQVLSHPVFLISTQLRKNWFARIFFHGIAVTRAKDAGDRSLNDAALARCLDHLQAGGKLFVFPEGTSSLGPRHLPFKSGGVWMLLDYLERGGPPLSVVPLGIHYECPWTFRGKVEVVIGLPISLELPAGASRMERLKSMKRRVQQALESVGINVPSEDDQRLIRRFAQMATLGSGRSYFQSLKTMEPAVPGPILEQWQKLEPDLREARPWTHQDVPLFPAGPVLLYVLALLAVIPILLLAITLNVPAFAAGWYAGRAFPDDRNVISLWKILVGLPAFALWLSAVVAALVLSRHIGWLAAYAAITWAGLKLYHPFKQLAVAVYNALRHPALRPRMLAFHQLLLRSLPDETH